MNGPFLEEAHKWSSHEPVKREDNAKDVSPGVKCTALQGFQQVNGGVGGELREESRARV